MRGTLRKKPVVVAAGVLAPAGIGVIAGGLRQYGCIVNPLLVAGKINQPLVVHERKA